MARSTGDMSPARELHPLLETLRALEVALHQPHIRGDRDALETLLHPGFRELGRSGASYTREQVLAELATEPQTYAVWSQNYQVELLAHDCALLTYKSAHVNAEGQLERHTNRSSIWQVTEGRWLLRFHQGTPTGAFAREF